MNANGDVSGRNPHARRRVGFGLLGVVIFMVCVILVAGGVSLVKWQQGKDIVRDARIVGHEMATLREPFERRDKEVLLVRIAEGLSPQETQQPLADMHGHDQLAGGFTLATAEGEPMWGLDDTFVNDTISPMEKIELALWLAQQEQSAKWTFGETRHGPTVTVTVDEDYKSLSLMKGMTEKFPQFDTNVSYRSVPSVTLPASSSRFVSSMEKALNTWARDPLTYGGIISFEVEGFEEKDGHYFDRFSGKAIDKPQLLIDFVLSGRDPAYYSPRKPQAAGDRRTPERAEEEHQNRLEEISQRYVDEGPNVVPDLTVVPQPH